MSPPTSPGPDAAPPLSSELLAELPQVVLSVNRAQRVDALAEVLLDWLDAQASPECVALLLRAGDQLRLCRLHGEAPRPRQVLPVADLLLQRLSAGRPLDGADYRAKPLADFATSRAYPLLGRDHLAGVLTTSWIQDPAARERVEGALSVLAPHLGLALDNLEITAQARQTIRRAREHEHTELAAAGFARAFAVAGSLGQLLGRILEQAIATANAQKGSLMLLDAASQELVVKVVRGLPDPALEDRINRGEVQCIRFKRGQGIAGRVLQAGKPLFSSNVHTDARFEGKGAHVGTIGCVPMRHEGETIGVINLTCAEADADLHHEAGEVLQSLADEAAGAILRAELYERAVTDPATGLYVGQMVEALLEAEVRRARRYGGALSVLTCQVGDPARRRGLDEAAIGAAFRCTIRAQVDLAGHLGNRLFLLVLPETPEEGAIALAHRLRVGLEPFVEAARLLVFAATEHQPEESAHALAERARRALAATLIRGPGVRIVRA